MHFFAVCFQKSHTWYGWLIRKLTGSPWNHVYIEYASDDWGQRFDLDITPRGVLSVPTKGRSGDVLKYMTNDVQDRDKVTDAMRDSVRRLGDRYDWVGLFSGLFRLIIWRIFGRRLLKSVHSKGRMFCSEMVSTILQGAFQDWDAKPSEISPADVLVYIKSHPERFFPLPVQKGK